MGAPFGNRNAAGPHRRSLRGGGHYGIKIPKGYRIRRRGGGKKSPFQKKRGSYRRALRGGGHYGK